MLTEEKLRQLEDKVDSFRRDVMAENLKLLWLNTPSHLELCEELLRLVEEAYEDSRPAADRDFVGDYGMK